MNKAYHILLEKLADKSHSNLSFDYVKSIIANTIKVRNTYMIRTTLCKYFNRILHIAYHFASAE